jgi:hypothetical protein
MTVLPTLCRTFRPIQKKISAADEKFGPPVSVSLFEGIWALKKKNCLCECENNNILGHFPRDREDKRRETILLKFGPFSALFVQNRPKIWPQNCPAAPLFIRPFLTYVSEQSANWQRLSND